MSCNSMPWRKVLSLVFATSALGSSPAFAGESEFHANFAVNQEYTDNVNETHSGSQRDFITRVMPGVSLKYKAPVWDWDVAYNLDYRYYAKGTHGNETTHNANVKSLVTVVENLLYLDVKDTYRRVSLDIARDRTQGSLSAHQSDQNVLDASPYFAWRIGNRGGLKTGYKYSNIWYREPDAIDKQTHSAFAEGSVELSPRTTGTVWYNYETSLSSSTDLQAHNAGASFRYVYADGSDLSGQFGNRWIRYENGVQVSGNLWSAGINHKMNNVMLKLKTEQAFEEDPATVASTRKTSHSGGLDATFDRGQVGFTGAYNRYTRGTGNRSFNSITLPEKERVYMASVNGKYSVTQHVTISVGVSGENFFTHYMFDSPRRIIADGAMSYVKDTLTVSLSYRYVDSFSKNVVEDNNDNYRVNRFMLEVRKVF